MTLSFPGGAASAAADQARTIQQQYATELELERTRLLYQGSQVPTLFMLLNALVCAALLWQPQPR